MKYTNIALAISAALALAACGGSSTDAVDDSHGAQPDQPSTSNPSPGNPGNPSGPSTGPTTPTTPTTPPSGGSGSGSNSGSDSDSSSSSNSGSGAGSFGDNHANNPSHGPNNPHGPTGPTGPTDPKDPKDPVVGDVDGAKEQAFNDNTSTYNAVTSLLLNTTDVQRKALPGDSENSAYARAKLETNSDDSYVSAEYLFADDQELDVASGTSASTQSNLYYKDGKEYKKAFIIGKKLYKSKDKASSMPGGSVMQEANKKEQLSASEVFHKVNQGSLHDGKYTQLLGVEVLGQTVAVEAGAAASKVKVDDVDRSKIPQGKILKGEITSKVKYNVHARDFSNGKFDKQKKLPDGTVISHSEERDITKATIRAYNLPYVLTTFVTDAKDDNAIKHFFKDSNVDDEGFQIFGEQTKILPANVEATYKGEGFTKDSTNKVSFDVEFSPISKHSLSNFKITDRKTTGGATLKSIVQTKATDAGDNTDFTIVHLEYEDGKSIETSDINKVKGAFYGKNAANAAGQFLNGSDKTTGVFGAAKQ